MEPLMLEVERTMTTPPSLLEEISTHWSSVQDGQQFVLRYAKAISKYLTAILGDAEEAAEAAQEFFVTGLRRGFVRSEPIRGRFRDYLKTAVRNAARTGLRRGSRTFSTLTSEPECDDATDAEWLAQWQSCVLERAWNQLDRQQRNTPGSLVYLVLKTSVEYPEEDSESQAARVAILAGRPIRADAFRKQLSRARQRFAEALVQEVSETLSDPTPENIDDELAALGMLSMVQKHRTEPREP
jgi:Sigma-70 region 2